MANDIITQLQARNETLTQAIARYGSLNASTLQMLTLEQTKIGKLMQQLGDSATRMEASSQRRETLLEKTQTFTGQFGKIFNVETPDWKLPYEFQDSMDNMATRGGMSDSTRDALSLNLRDWSMDFNQEQKTLQAAALAMIEGNVTSLQDLNRYMPEIAKAATATRDSAETWAQAANATHDHLNISSDNFPSAQNMMNSVAKGSGLSIAEQTQWIEAFASKTGLQGTEGIAELTATMQIAMKNGASASTAAQNFEHFLQTTFSKETDRWFTSQGVDLQGSLLEHQQNGVGVAEAMTHIVQMQLEKMNPEILETFKRTMKIEDLSVRNDALKTLATKFNLGQMFSDPQTVDFLAPMLANMDEYRQLKTSAMQAAGINQIDADFTERMTSSDEQTKALQLAVNDLWLSIGLQLLPAIGELAQNLTPIIRQFSTWLRENPTLVQGLAKLVGTIWLFNGALNILKLSASLITAPFIRLIDIFLKIKASLALGGAASTTLSVLKSLGSGTKILAAMTGRTLVNGLKLVGQTFIWLGRALLMNPIGLIITAIAGAAYLIYRYWEPISGFFFGIWDRVKTAFAGGIAGITGLILDWSPLGLFYNIFSSALEWFGVEMPASFSEFGGNILDSLVNGILNALPFLNGAIEKIKSLIPDWAKNTLGIGIEEPDATTVPMGITGTTLAHPVSMQLTPGTQTAMMPLKSGVKDATSPTPATISGKPAAKSYAMPSRSQSNVQVHFAPHVTVQGSGQNSAKDINNVLALSKHELEKMINDVMAQQQRRGYA